MSLSNNYWAELIAVLAQFPCLTRVKWIDSDVSQWDDFLIVPVPGYIESRIGPVPMREVEWIEVKSTESRHRGRLIPDTLVDHASSLADRFNEHSLRFERVAHGFRIYPPAANSK